MANKNGKTNGAPAQANDNPLSVDGILHGSSHALTLFSAADIAAVEATLFDKNGKTYLKCLATEKDRPAKPEEIVRQLWIHRLMHDYEYPADRLRVEHPIQFGREVKKADITVMDKDRPSVELMIVEVKKVELKDGKKQLRSYCNATGAPVGVWSNGGAEEFYHRKDPNYFEKLLELPTAHQKLADVIGERLLLADLARLDTEKAEHQTLRDLIVEMEDEVLTHDGVDVFNEGFKLIFAKLYDEAKSGENQKRPLEFRNIGTETEVKERLQRLLDDAIDKWEKVFPRGTRIDLSPTAARICVSYLENRRLLNSNLDFVDEAFEYLTSKRRRGEKGQYFTPRWVVDMAVRMLNPREEENMVDTACGSAGFTVHTIFHVWKQILADEGLDQSHLFTAEPKPARCADYVRDHVYAIDFDLDIARVARCLNIIAGDGQTNVLHLNTLDYRLWDEVTRQPDWIDAFNEGFKRFKRLRTGKDSWRDFGFDVLMANPPFAPDIDKQDILSLYDLGHKANGKPENAVSRAILFIERNLNCLRPGGRMAIVLPQGVLNNGSDKRVREYIAERCRILAVVGLHPHTFKPHTGTKTSIVFVQKWNDDPKAGALCPKKADYPIFFATQRLASKDSGGKKIIARGKDRKPLRDSHGHWVVQHDLFNHDGLTQDGVAEAFAEFASREKLSFF